MTRLLRLLGIILASLLTCGFFIIVLPVLLILGLFFKGIQVKTINPRGAWRNAPNQKREESQPPSPQTEDDIIDVTAQQVDRKELTSTATDQQKQG